MSSDSTKRWEACAIDYLWGTAAEWAHLLWPLTANNTPVVTPTYKVDWHSFKQEFIWQHVPADAILVLQRQFKDLALNGPVRAFNERFRLLRMRLHLATKETPPILQIGNDSDTTEANRAAVVQAEAPLVNHYSLKLQ